MFLYPEFIGENLGVIIGRVYDFSVHGIHIYEPKGYEPSREMSTRELNAFLREVHGVTIPYYSVRKVSVDGEAVWQNYKEFLEPAAGSYFSLQDYIGKGTIHIELLDNEAFEETVTLIVESGIRIGSDFGS